MRKMIYEDSHVNSGSTIWMVNMWTEMAMHLEVNVWSRFLTDLQWQQYGKCWAHDMDDEMSLLRCRFVIRVCCAMRNLKFNSQRYLPHKTSNKNTNKLSHRCPSLWHCRHNIKTQKTKNIMIVVNCCSRSDRQSENRSLWFCCVKLNCLCNRFSRCLCQSHIGARWFQFSALLFFCPFSECSNKKNCR